MSETVKPPNEKRNFISTSSHVLFCLSYKHTDDDLFDHFPKISEHFPKVSKIREDFKGKPNISEEVPMMFRSYSNTPKYFLRDYVTKAMVIFSPVKLFSWVKIYRGLREC